MYICIYILGVCHHDSKELNKRNFIIATIIISTSKLSFSLNKVLLFQGSRLGLHCIISSDHFLLNVHFLTQLFLLVFSELIIFDIKHDIGYKE